MDRQVVGLLCRTSDRGREPAEGTPELAALLGTAAGCTSSRTPRSSRASSSSCTSTSTCSTRSRSLPASRSGRPDARRPARLPRPRHRRLHARGRRDHVGGAGARRAGRRRDRTAAGTTMSEETRTASSIRRPLADDLRERRAAARLGAARSASSAGTRPASSPRASASTCSSTPARTGSSASTPGSITRCAAWRARRRRDGVFRLGGPAVRRCDARRLERQQVLRGRRRAGVRRTPAGAADERGDRRVGAGGRGQ